MLCSRRMRLTLAISLFVLCALKAWAQLAPELVRGTSSEDVIRQYGWPKGKSATEGREIWIYDRFQVRFEEGKVAAVSYSAPTPGAPRAPIPKLVPAAATPAPQLNRPAAPTATQASAAGANARLSDLPKPTPPLIRSPLKDFMPALVVALVGPAVVIFLVMKRRRDEATANELLLASAALPPAPAKE
jgi:hypothetical protein